MAEYPALPIFIDAWALDCAHLSDAEDGRYFRLCRLMWSQPECRIPNDDAWIARKLSRTVEDVQRDIRPVIAEFCQSDGNWITQKRLQKEWRYVRATSRKRSVAGKRRWNNNKSSSPAVANGAEPGLAPTPTPTPIYKEPDGSLLANGAARHERRTKSRTRLSPDWQPSEQGWAYATERGCGSAEVERFKNHHAGKGSLMADWDAAWRTWCGNAQRFGAAPYRGGNGSGGKGVVAALRILRAADGDG